MTAHGGTNPNASCSRLVSRMVISSALAPARLSLAPCSPPSRTLRAASRWPAAILDRSCAQRLRELRPGRRNGSQPNRETPDQPRDWLSLPTPNSEEAHYVDRARAKADLSTVRRVAIDETAARRGHNYITLFVDIDQARVVFATDGRDAETIAFFADDLTMHGGAPSAIAEVCIDMSPAFIKGIANSLPAAAITFDKFHAVKIVNDAVDQVRRAERKVHNVLAGTRYLWLRNPVNLSDRQRAAFENLPLRHLKTARAYRIRLAFQELYDQPTPDAATVFLKKWYFWATHSRLPPIIDAARTVKRHWNGILRWFHSRIANGLIEGINSLVQAAKAKARGYRSVRNLKAMVYLLAAKLNLMLPN